MVIESLFILICPLFIGAVVLNTVLSNSVSVCPARDVGGLSARGVAHHSPVASAHHAHRCHVISVLHHTHQVRRLKFHLYGITCLGQEA